MKKTGYCNIFGPTFMCEANSFTNKFMCCLKMPRLHEMYFRKIRDFDYIEINKPKYCSALEFLCETIHVRERERERGRY